MPGMLIGQATLLYRLQTLDLAIAQHRARLEQIAAALGDDEAVGQARLRLEQANEALRPWQTRARDVDLEIKGLVQKIQQTDRMLYSGKISNPKELQDMQNELVSLKRRQSQLEDELLEAMLHSDEGQTAVAEAQNTLGKVQATWTGSQSALVGEKQRLEQELAELTEKRKQAAAGVDAASLAKYEALRARKRGQAVALLQGNSCALCGVEQTSALAQQVRQSGLLIYCESCGRILATP